MLESKMDRVCTLLDSFSRSKGSIFGNVQTCENTLSRIQHADLSLLQLSLGMAIGK